MITLDLSHLFKTNPNSTEVPHVVSDWVLEREKLFPDIEFKISFWSYRSKEEKDSILGFERIYGPSLPRLRDVSFPLNDGLWKVRLIGDQKMAVEASGLLGLLKSQDSRVEIIPSGDEKVSLRGYTRVSLITSLEEEMVNIRCDRNVNDEWEFRGTGQEFLDETGL